MITVPRFLALSLVLAGMPLGLGDAERALLDAAGAGDASRVRRAIAAGARIEARDASGRTPLMRAAGTSSAESVRVLLEAGANPSAARASGATALTEASANGRLESARLLLAAGAEPDARDRALGTPLDLAERAGHERLADVLRRHGARGSGRSVGDGACVLRWNGAGYCGRIEAVDGTRSQLRVESVRGCTEGCAAEPDCSEGRAVGGAGSGAVREGDAVWARSWCLTHTGLP